MDFIFISVQTREFCCFNANFALFLLVLRQSSFVNLSIKHRSYLPWLGSTHEHCDHLPHTVMSSFSTLSMAFRLRGAMFPALALTLTLL